jgi:hypothetical protein
MIRRRKTRNPTAFHFETTPSSGDVHDWVLSLPWVVERPATGAPPGLRLFAVDCEPLQRRQIWLATGLRALDNDDAIGIAAVMPVAAVQAPHTAEWVVQPATLLPAGHVLVMLQRESTRERDEIERFVLAAYSQAMP